MVCVISVLVVLIDAVLVVAIFEVPDPGIVVNCSFVFTFADAVIVIAGVFAVVVVTICVVVL